MKYTEEQAIAKFFLSKRISKNEIIHFINRCRAIPMVGSILHIKGLSSTFYNLLKEIIEGQNVKNNYQINGECLRNHIIKTFDL